VSSLFVVMAFVNPGTGKEKEMADRMRSFRELLRTKSGLVHTFLLSENGGSTLVGVSMWTDEAAYQNAMITLQAARPSTQPDVLRESPPTMREFSELQ
jgi:quinol monooxygenase YgiN